MAAPKLPANKLSQLRPYVSKETYAAFQAIVSGFEPEDEFLEHAWSDVDLDDPDYDDMSGPEIHAIHAEQRAAYIEHEMLPYADPPGRIDRAKRRIVR